MAENEVTTPQKEDDILLSEELVWDVIAYARGLVNNIYGSSVLTPDLINSRMKDVTFNPMAPNQDTLDKAMLDPKNNEIRLQEFSQDFELRSMIYKRMIGYLSNILSFDYTYTSDAEPDQYGTPRYKSDTKILEKFFKKFDHKYELRIAVREMLRNDAYFACLIDTGDKYVLQELPSEYCKITGRWGGGFLFSFNMYWFLQPGVDINLYPDFFKKKYREKWGSSPNPGIYNPSLSPEDRGRSGWVYWVDIPVSFGVCFKLSPELATRLPYFTPLFNDLILQSLMRNLQRNVNMAVASRIIIGEVPMQESKDSKATLKNNISISPDLLGKFMALVKSAISESVKLAAAPIKNIKDINFDPDDDMYDKYLRTAFTSSGTNANVAFGSSTKPNNIETQLSLNADEQMMEILYSQFDDFVNYHLGRLTKTFKFTVRFEGTNFFLNRQQRLDKAMLLLNAGMPLPQKIAASIGMSPFEFKRHLEEARETGFVKSLTPPSIENQRKMAEIANEYAPDTNTEEPTKKVDSSTGKPTKRGRPKKSESELSDEGQNTRDGATNVGRGGDI